MLNSEQLIVIAQLKYDKRRRSLTAILSEEMALRDQLKEIDRLDQESSDADANSANIKSLGADILWQSWVSRSKGDINVRISNVLARKLLELAKVRHSFGRLTALNELAERNRRINARSLKNASISKILDMNNR